MRQQPDLAMDVFIAEKVMGWKVKAGTVQDGELLFVTPSGDVLLAADRNKTEFSPTTEESDAVRALNEIKARASGVDYPTAGNHARATVYAQHCNKQAEGDTTLLAVCAALKLCVEHKP